MAKRTFEVNFRINGELSKSLGAALKAAQQQMSALANTKIKGGNFDGALKAAAQNMGAFAAASKAANIANVAGVDKLVANLERLQQVSANVEQFKRLTRELDNLKQTSENGWREVARHQVPYETQYRAVEQQRQRLQANQQGQAQQAQVIAAKNAAWKQAVADRNVIKVDISDLTSRIKAAAKGSPERAALTAERERLRGLYNGESKERVELARADFKDARAALAQMKSDAEAINRQLQSAAEKLEPKRRLYESARERAQKTDQRVQSQQADIANLRGALKASGFDVAKMSESAAKLKAELESAHQAIQGRVGAAMLSASLSSKALSPSIDAATKAQRQIERRAGWMQQQGKLPAVKGIDAKDERGRTEQALTRLKDYSDLAKVQLRTRQEMAAAHGTVVKLGQSYTQQQRAAANLSTQLETLKAVYREHGAKLPESQAREMAQQIQQLAQANAAAEQSLKSTLTSLSAAKAQWRTLNESVKSQGAAVQNLSGTLKGAGVEVPSQVANEAQLRSAVEATTKALEQRLAVYQRLAEAQARVSASANEMKRQAKEQVAAARAKIEGLKAAPPPPAEPLLARITSAWQNVATHQRLAAAGSTFVAGYNLSAKLAEQFEAVQRIRQKLERQSAWLKRQGKLPKIKAIDAKDDKARLEQTLGRLGEYRELIKLQTRTRQEMMSTHGAVVKLGQSYVRQKAAAAELKTQLESLRAVQRDHSQNLTASQNQNLARQIQQLSEAHAKAEQSIKSTWTSLSSAKGQWGNLHSAFKSQSTAAQELSGVLKAAGANVLTFAAAEARLKSELDSVTRSLESQAAAAKRQEHLDNVGQKFSNAYNDFQNIVSTAQTVMAPFADSVDVAASFEKQMSVVKALTQMDNLRRGNLEQSEKEMRALTEQSKHLGLTTQFTAIQAAQGQTYLAYAGMTTPQILDLMPTVLNVAAAAGMADLGRVADIFTDIGMAFKIPADQMRHVGDVLTYTFTHSNQNFEQLAETMKYAAPIARLFGSSIEETAAITKFMADSGIKGSMAGTATRSIMTRLVAPPKTASKAMEENGITLADANKEWLNANEIAESVGIHLEEGLTAGQQMASVIRQINDKMGNLSSHEKLGIFKAVTGMYALSGAANLFETGGELIDDEYNPGKKITRLEAFTRDLENSGGSADQTAKIMLDNYAGQVTLLKSAIEGLQVEVGAALTPTIRAVVETVTPMITKFAEFNQAHPQIIQGAAAIATGLTAVAAGAAGISLAFAGWNFVSTNLAALGDKVAAFGTRIASLSISPALTNAGLAFVALKSKAGAALEFVMTKAGALVTFLRGLTWASVVAGAKSLGTALLGLAKSFGLALRAGLMFAFSPIGMAAMALGLMAVAVYKNWDKLAPVFEHLASVVGGTLSNAFNAVSPSISNAVAALDRLFESMGQGSAADVLAKAFILAVNVIVGALTTLVDAAANAFAALMDIVGGGAEVLTRIMEGDFAGAFEAAGKYKEDFKKHAWDAITAIPRGVERTADATEESWRLYDEGERNRKIRAQQEVGQKLADQTAQYRQRVFAEREIDPDKHREQIALRRKAERAGYYSAYHLDDGTERRRVTDKDLERYSAWKAEDDKQGRAERLERVRAANAETLERAEQIGIAPNKRYDQEVGEWVYSIPLTQEQRQALKGLSEPSQKRIAHNLDIDTSGWGETLTAEQRAQVQAAYKKQRESIEAAAASAPPVPQGLPEPEVVRNAAIPNAEESARIAERARLESRAIERTAKLERAIEQTQNLPSTPPNYLQPATAQTYMPGEAARLEALRRPAAEPAPKPTIEVKLPTPESVRNAAIPTAAEMERIAVKAREDARAEYRQAQLEQIRESVKPVEAPREQTPWYHKPQIPMSYTPGADVMAAPAERTAPAAIPTQSATPPEVSSRIDAVLNTALSSGVDALTTAIFGPFASLFTSQTSAATPESVGAPSVQLETANVQAQLDSLGAAAGTNAESFTAANQQFTTLTATTEQAQAPLAAIMNSTEAFGERLQAMAQSTSEVQTATQTTAETLESVTAPVQETANQLEQTSSSVSNVNETFSQVTQAISESVSTFNESVSAVSTSLTESFTAATTTVQESFAQVGAALQSSTVEIQQLTGSVTANNATVQQSTSSLTANIATVQQSTAAFTANAASAQTSSASLLALSGAAQGAVGGITALGGSSSNAAGSVSALGAAAANAVASMQSAAASISAAAANVGRPAQNYKGGIYHQGAFLTWFAEKSPEAAIPLDGSERAIGLWRQAGSMLGVYPYEQASYNAAPELKPAENYAGGIYERGGKDVTQSEAQRRALARRAAVVEAYREKAPVTELETEGDTTRMKQRGVVRLSESELKAAANAPQVEAPEVAVTPPSAPTPEVSAAAASVPAQVVESPVPAKLPAAVEMTDAQRTAAQARILNRHKERAEIAAAEAARQGTRNVKPQNYSAENFERYKKLTGSEIKPAAPATKVMAAAASAPQQVVESPSPAAVQESKATPTPEVSAAAAKAPTLSAQMPPAERRAAIVQIYREEAERQGLLNSGKALKPETFTAENQARLKELGAWSKVERGAAQLERSAESLEHVESDTRAESKSLERVTATTATAPKPEVVAAAAKVPAQVVAQEPKKSSGKNFFEKGVEATNDFFFKLFHPRKYAAKQRGYETDKLGNIIGLGGLPDNVITEDDTPSVREDKRKAQVAEFEKKRAAAQVSGAPSEATVEAASTSSAIGQSKRNALADWNLFATGTSNLGGVLKNVFGGDPRSNQRAEFGNLLGGGSPLIDAGLSLLSGGGLMGAVNAYFTPKNVKAQRGAQAALEKTRGAKLSDKVKGSKSYQVMTGTQSRGTGGALTAARQSDGQNVIRNIKSGNWAGVLGGLGAMYSRSLEIGGMQSVGVPGGGSSQGTKLPLPIMHQNAATTQAASSPALQTASATAGKTGSGKNFIEKGVEAASDYFMRIFHPQKYAAKKRGYETDKLGNIIGLGGLPDNVITEDDTPSVREDKRKAQVAEFEKKRAAAQVSGAPSEATVEAASTPSAIGQSKRNALADWNLFATGTSNLGGVLKNVFGGDPRSNQRAEFGNLLGGGSPLIDAGLSLLSGGGLMGAVNAYFTPKNVKAQRGAQAALEKTRGAKLSDKVKGSKSYQVMTGTQSRGTGGALTAARQSDGQNVIRNIKSGNWTGVLGGLGAMYSRSLEIGGMQSVGGSGGGSSQGTKLPLPIMHQNAVATQAASSPAVQTAATIQNEVAGTPVASAAAPAAEILTEPTTAANAEVAAPAAAIMTATGPDGDGLEPVRAAAPLKREEKIARIQLAQSYLPTSKGAMPSQKQMDAAGLTAEQRRNLARIEAAQNYLPGGSGHVSEEQMRAAGLSETQQQNLNRLELAQQYLPQTTTQENFVTQWQSTASGAQMAQLEHLEAQSRPAEFHGFEGGGETESSAPEIGPISLTFNVTIQGNADRNEVQAGVQQSIPLIRESFEDQLRRYQHENRRRSMIW